jgi:hypothetical protein
MASNAVPTQGTVVAIDNGSAVFTTIGEVRTLSLPGNPAPEIDVTHLGSTAREFRLGLADNGTASLTCAHVFDDAGQVIVRGLAGSSTVRKLRVTYPESPAQKIEFDVLVQQVSHSVDIDTTWTAEFTFRVTGARTYGAA